MRNQRVLILILVGWYLILVLGHYFDERPLWLDEQFVFNNIVRLKPASLFTRTLLNGQAFPRVYLWVIQQCFGQNFLILRLFPLLAMIGAFFVWLKIAYRVLDGLWDLALFIGCWCASIPLVYHAAELKPYSMDVLVSGLFVLFLLDLDQIIKSRACHYFLLPFLGLWSYTAIFFYPLPLYNLVRECLAQRRWINGLSFYMAGCVLTLGLVYLFDLRVSIVHIMTVVWHDYFISMDSMKDFLNSFGKGMNNLISRRFAENPRWIKVPSRVFIGLGVFYMLMVSWERFKRDRFALRSIVPITMAMFLIQLVLAILLIYPFAVPRLSLFFTPLLFLMAIMSLRFLYGKNRILGSIFQIIFAGYLAFVSLGIAWDVFLNKDLGAMSGLYSPMH